MRRRLTTIWVIAYREVVTRGTSKAFRISTGLLLLGLVLGIVIPGVFMRGASRYTVAVVGAGAGVPAAISAQSATAGITVTTRPAADRAAAVESVESGTASAAVIGTHELIWKDTEDKRLAAVLTAALAQSSISQRAHGLGLTPAQLAKLLASARPAVTRLHPQPNRTPQTVIAVIGLILLFTALNLYGSYVLTGVVEEKSSRVVEVLLARVRPADLLAGKVAGIGVLGIGQFLGLGAVAAVTLQLTQPPNLPPGTFLLIASVVLWFILGYSFYSMLYGALGALASRVQDAQAAAGPVTVFLILIYLGALMGLTHPHAWWVTAGSLFPPSAPIFMPVRAALNDVPAWQVGAAVVLMLLVILALIRAGGRVYRGGVLHTGGRLGLRKAWQRA